jgi:enoyl-CoA hydratase/carnithine racemase
MSDPILYEVRDHVAILTLNRPEKLNPISDPEMIEALLASLQRIEMDAGVRVAIITGAGRGFSSGGDVRKMDGKSGINDVRAIRTRQLYRHGIQRLPRAFVQLEVPIIAAVNGPAFGAGFDLTCMCDLRIASESAKFAENFVKLGLIAGDGGSWLLPRVIGFSKACEMALTGDMLGAAEALACGLVSKVVPDAELLPEALRLAGRIAANPPYAVRMTKRLLWEGREMNLSALLDLAASMQSLAHLTDDHQEAVQAFIEKRKPSVTGN